MTIWISEVGGLEIGLALWLIIIAFLLLGLNPAFTVSAKNYLRFSLLGIWLIFEGVLYKGMLFIRPTVNVISKWPARMNNWFEKPERWAVPFEVLVSSIFLLIVYLSLSAFLKEKKR